MNDEIFMRRCIQLAQNARCTAAPNPMVGAVIVNNGRIIGEGFHVHCGQAHAEVNAIASVRDESLLASSTIYVSLEPCSHYGKTPPCADLIIRKGIPRIVVGCQDPFARVAGRGIEKLRQAGHEVVVGVLETECRHLIRRFITFHTERRPFITLKWAESADGFIDRIRTASEAPTRLSSPLTQMLAHKRRSEHQAILVGHGTALMDNPRLDVRQWCGRPPLRIVLTHAGAPATHSHLADGGVETMCHAGSLDSLLATLYDRGIQTLLVEGGAQVLQQFINAGLWDEAWVEESPMRLGGGVAAPSFKPHTPCSAERCFGRDYRHYEKTTL